MNKKKNIKPTKKTADFLDVSDPGEGIGEPKQQKAPSNITSFQQLIGAETGYTARDMDLLMSLGFENELSRQTGVTALKGYQAEKLLTKRAVPFQGTVPDGCTGSEYNGTQGKGIHRQYERQIQRHSLRLFCYCMLIFLSICVETSALSSAISGGLTELYYWVQPLFRVVLLVVATGFSFREYLWGLKALFRRNVTPYTGAAFFTIGCILCSAYVIVSSGRAVSPTYLVTPAVIYTAFCVLMDLFQCLLSRSMFGFLETPTEKTVTIPLPDRKKRQRRNGEIVGVQDENRGLKLYRAFGTKFVAGFFRRIGNIYATNTFFNRHLPVSILLSGVFAILKSVMRGNGDFNDNVNTAMVGFFELLILLLPMSYLFGWHQSYLRANRLLLKKKCLLVGEETVAEATDTTTLVIPEEDLVTAKFRSCRVLCSAEDSKYAKAIAGRLFRGMGGALKMATPKQDDTDMVQFIRVTDSGLEAVVNGDSCLLGIPAFLTEAGVAVNTEPVAPSEADDGILYLAINGVIQLRYAIHYELKSGVAEMLKDLQKQDIQLGFLSYNPSLNDIFMKILLAKCGATVHIIRPARLDAKATLEASDSGMVAEGKETQVLYPILAAKQVLKCRQKLGIWQTVCNIFSLAWLVLSSLFEPEFSVSFYQPFLLQLLGMAVAFVIVRTHFKALNFHFPENQNE